MSTHITTPPRAEQTEPEAAEPAHRAARFDERGIALQTIIIMVVLLAIAGAVAAVLFSRASTETARLEGAEDTFAYAVGDRLQCQSLGHTWQDGRPSGASDVANVKAALNVPSDWSFEPATATVGEGHGQRKGGSDKNYYMSGWCKPQDS